MSTPATSQAQIASQTGQHLSASASRYNPAPLQELLGNLQGGVLTQIVEDAIASGAAAACQHRGTAEINLVLKIKPLANTNNMVELTHALKSVQPTLLGTKQENIKGMATLYASHEGNLSPNPHKQRDFIDEAKVIAHQ